MAGQSPKTAPPASPRQTQDQQISRNTIPSTERSGIEKSEVVGSSAPHLTVRSNDDIFRGRNWAKRLGILTSMFEVNPVRRLDAASAISGGPQVSW